MTKGLRSAENSVSAGDAAGGSPLRLRKHSVVIAGHRTSISLEDAFWQGLQTIAGRRGISLASLIASIDAGRGEANLSSAIRVHVLDNYSGVGTANRVRELF